VKATRIYLSAPDVGLAEEKAVARAVRSGWVAPLGPEVEAFEKEIASFVGGRYGVALSSGTAALHLGLKALGVKAGDVVITSSMTFVATANAIVYTGARPVFVDSLADGSPDPAQITRAIEGEQAAGHKIGAIVPVDIYGRVANYPEILRIAESFAIPVLADAAEALGSTHQGKPAGSFGQGAALSFNGNKIMTTSGGGMFLTSDPEKALYVKYLATQAREPAVHYEHVELGYNYRLSNLSAAIGRAQLLRLPEMITRRRSHRKTYQEFFSGLPGVSLLHDDAGEDNCWLTAIVVDKSLSGWTPEELRNFLELQGVESRPLWKPMHLQPLYRTSRYYGEAVAKDLFDSGLALPSGSALGSSEINRVLDSITTFLKDR